MTFDLSPYGPRQTCPQSCNNPGTRVRTCRSAPHSLHSCQRLRLKFPHPAVPPFFYFRAPDRTSATQCMLQHLPSSEAPPYPRHGTNSCSTTVPHKFPSTSSTGSKVIRHHEWWRMSPPPRPRGAPFISGLIAELAGARAVPWREPLTLNQGLAGVCVGGMARRCSSRQRLYVGVPMTSFCSPLMTVHFPHRMSLGAGTLASLSACIF